MKDVSSSHDIFAPDLFHHTRQTYAMNFAPIAPHQRLLTRSVLLLACSFLFSLASLQAKVRLASVFSSHMVLQRDRPIHIWGSAEPEEKGEVAFRGMISHFDTNPLGRWSVYLPPSTAGGSFTLTVQSTERIELTDILVGDIWVASGQSNMQFAMQDKLANGAQSIAAANLPQVRLLTIKDAFADHPLEDAANSGWMACTPDTVKDFSAVAYFFSRNLNEDLKVPIGIIHASWGGTPAEAWTSLDALSRDDALMPVFAARASMMDQLNTTIRRQQSETHTNDALTKEGKPALDVPWRPNPDTWAPAALYNAMIAPLTPLPIRGIIWYQGESNTGSARFAMYVRVFRALISDWRQKWSDEGLPFLYVQLANFENSDNWPAVREAQRKTLDLRDTGMAITIDIGEAKNIHPSDKEDVGLRLALLARKLVYGEDLEASGPLFRSAAPIDGAMVVSFTHAAGLSAAGGDLGGFEVAAEDGTFVPAVATILGDTVHARTMAVPHPCYVRYAWSNNPHASLFNGAQLPASPFSSE